MVEEEFREDKEVQETLEKITMDMHKSCTGQDLDYSHIEIPLEMTRDKVLNVL